MRPPLDRPRLAIGIATRGRPDVLLETLRELGRQTRPADRIVVAHTTAADIQGAGAVPGVEFLLSAAGLPHQRNAILRALGSEDFVLFLDDDFLPAPQYIEATLAAFAAAPGVVVTTGRILADGARGPGHSVAEGRAILLRHADDGNGIGTRPTFNGYGCNMAFCLRTVRAHALWFDERLPLYAWYEDIDMCRRLGRHGEIVEVMAACGVHLGVKHGRGSGRRLGYSQVVNPLYLWRKGSFPLDRALRSVGRHLLINSIRALRPEPWVDRRGRMIGNALALLDIVRRRARPERVLEL